MDIGAAFGWFRNTGEDLKQRTLARSVAANDADDLAALKETSFKAQIHSSAADWWLSPGDGC
jgi:hypothetical protein